MNRKFISTLSLIATAAIASLTTSTANAALPGKLLDQTGCCKRCPACDHCCELEAKVVDKDIKCFDVESKVICIPRVVFPWQKKKCGSCTSCDGAGCNNCVNNGARTRRVCVLKEDKYTCPKCEYKWTPKKKENCGCSSCGGCSEGCDGGECCDTMIGSTSSVVEGYQYEHPLPEPISVQPSYQHSYESVPTLAPVQVESAH